MVGDPKLKTAALIGVFSVAIIERDGRVRLID